MEVGVRQLLPFFKVLLYQQVTTKIDKAKPKRECRRGLEVSTKEESKIT